MTKLLPVFMLLVGCTGSLAQQRPQPNRCVQLDDRRMFFGMAAKGSAVLAGGSGLATIPLDEGTAQTGVAIGGVVAAAVAAGAMVVAEGAGESFARECTK